MSAEERVWIPPREEDSPRLDWQELARLARHRSNLLQRSLLEEMDRVVADLLELQELDDAALDAQIKAARGRVRQQSGLQGGPGARSGGTHPLAVVAECAAREIGLRAYPVQLRASLAMGQGCAVQMAAGEGKTLSVALAAVLEGWLGRVCHVVTANDYLAARDADLMRSLYARCGLSVAAVLPEMETDALRAAHGADVVYATGKQLLADYLRDQLLIGGASDGMARLLWSLRGDGAPTPVTRGLYSAIVDEADSVLIDDATTPLIISAPEPDALLEEAVLAARTMVDALEPGIDYLLDPVYRDVQFSDRGEDRLDVMMLDLAPLWRARERREELLTQAILARDVFERDRHYIVDDGKVVIVDENTGRAMPGRSWSYGLHQAIEAREELPITPPSRTLARMSFQTFFGKYHRLSGASGTLQNTAFELWSTYRLLPVVIPNRVPSRLEVPPTRCFPRMDDKWNALVEEVLDCADAGLPVLVGTRRISDTERLSEALRERGVEVEVLNAKEHASEAVVIARAGEPGRITVATNMAGRGTDIKLSDAVSERGGLQVLMLDPHESARVDWQLFGRAGRHGSRGRALAFAAVEDDLIERFLPWYARPLVWWYGGGAGRDWSLRLALKVAQRGAQRHARFSRQQLQRREKLMRKQLSFTGRADLASQTRASGLRGPALSASGDL